MFLPEEQAVGFTPLNQKVTWINLFAALFSRRKCAAPTAMTTAATITTAAMLADCGLITGTHAAGATQAYTLPTGTVLAAALLAAGKTYAIGESFDFTILNLSAAVADTITLTAAADITIVGNPIIASSHATRIDGMAATFRVRMSAAGVFVAYRVS